MKHLIVAGDSRGLGADMVRVFLLDEGYFVSSRSGPHRAV
jgi:hypothetical protein